MNIGAAPLLGDLFIAGLDHEGIDAAVGFGGESAGVEVVKLDLGFDLLKRELGSIDAGFIAAAADGDDEHGGEHADDDNHEQDFDERKASASKTTASCAAGKTSK